MHISGLNDNVIHEILCKISNFSDLSSTLLMAKQPFYMVFRAYPKSVLEAVACNVAGPAYSEAVQVSWYTSHPQHFKSNWDESRLVAFPFPLRRDHVDTLENNAHRVNELESLFSVR